MGQYESVTEQDLKIAIKSFLQEIIAENQTYIAPLKAIQSQLSTTTKSVRVMNNFSKVLKSKGYAYYGLALSKESNQRLNQMSQLYHLYSEITTKLLGLNKLTYSIYYKDSNGDMLRISVQDISKATSWLLNDSPTSQLYLKGSTIKEVFAQELQDIKNEQEYTKALTSHYGALEALLRVSYKGQSYQSKVGKYIPEAFERDVLSYPHTVDSIDSFYQHNWNLQEAWNLIRMSSGNAPWYSGGDVLSKMFNVQVKGFTSDGKEASASGKKNPFYRITGLTTLRSLEDIANYLVTLLDVTPATLDNKVEEIYRLFNQDDWEHKVDLEIENDKEKIINKLLKLGHTSINFNLI